MTVYSALAILTKNHSIIKLIFIHFNLFSIFSNYLSKVYGNLIKRLGKMFLHVF